MRRVAITGMGLVAPNGADAESFFEALAQGRSAVRRVQVGEGERACTALAAPVDVDLRAHFDAARQRMLDRVSQLALLAAAQAVAQSGALEGLDAERGGVFVGTGMGGAETNDDGYRTLYAAPGGRLPPFSVLRAMNSAAASWIGLEYRLRGPNLTYSTACSSSAVAVGEAARRIAMGEADVMIAGGAEAPIAYGTLKAWEALKTLASEDPRDASASCKPFSRDRSGLVLGEGAAMVVLEPLERARSRGAPVLAELAGYGLANDASHITRPSVEGQAAAMRRALDSARLPPGAIGYVNAHGTGTAANDGVETAAIKAVFGEHARRLAVSSTKSMHGHLLGAAGAVELVAAVMALRRGLLPPTQHLEQPDPECDLDYVPLRARAAAGLEAVMSSSFAFGGTNAVLVARRAGEP